MTARRAPGRVSDGRRKGRGGSNPAMRPQRLQKIIAEAGLASRREAEQWILDGRVTVNGRVITRLGTSADPETDHVRVDGKLLHGPAERAYYAFHKPPGVVSTMKDEKGRTAVVDFLEGPQRRQGVFSIGRLDYNSSGLLLLTNDGPLAHRVMHPRYQVRKVYAVKLSSLPSEEQLDRLRRGVRLSDGPAGPAAVRVTRRLKQKVWLEVAVREGRYREVRRMMEAIGHKVERLVRIRIGAIALGDLPPGGMRPLATEQVREIRRLVGLGGPGGRSRSAGGDTKAATSPSRMHR